ncbi:MAG: class I SAM-dependent methyltransferase [Vicinamibacterales bacterium]
MAKIARLVGNVPIRVLFPSGAANSIGAQPIATIRIHSRLALARLLRDPDMNFGEAFMDGAIEVDGDLVALLEAVFRASDERVDAGRRSRHANPPSASRDNVHHHYDIGNEFYRLWLDRELAYTCAFFPTPDASLEDAQVAKFERVSAKLRLSPGEKVVEAGCGWGGLAIHMVRHHGVRVRAWNVSHEQVTYARERAAREHLSHMVEFVEDDYRSIDEPADAFVSVGMLEHVGPADYPAFARVIRRTIGDRGRGLLHFIGRARPLPLNPWIRRRIFPGAYPPTLPEAFAGVLEPARLAVLDVENLRLHYAKTLDHWRRRYIASSEEVARMFDERFRRAWLLYLSGSQAAFQAGSLQLFQVLFAPAASNRIPWSRDDRGSGTGIWDQASGSGREAAES